MRRVVGLPDLHPGRGYPVGAAFFSVGRFYPALVGNDIGCGMALGKPAWPPASCRRTNWKSAWAISTCRWTRPGTIASKPWSCRPASTGARSARSVAAITSPNYSRSRRCSTRLPCTPSASMPIACNCWCTAARAGSARRSCKSMSACTATPACSTAAWKLPPTWRATPMRCASPRVTAAHRPAHSRTLALRRPGTARRQPQPGGAGTGRWRRRLAAPQGRHPGRPGRAGDPRLARRLQLPGGACAERAEPVLPGPRRRSQMAARRVSGASGGALQRRPVGPYAPWQQGDLWRPPTDLRGSAGSLQGYRLGGRRAARSRCAWSPA